MDESKTPSTETKKDSSITIIPNVEIDKKAGDVLLPDYKNKYNLSIVLPLKNEEVNDKYFQYYSGLKLASSALENEGINLNINVYNSNDISYLQKLNATTDLVFTPNDEKQLKSISSLAKENKFSIVSPFVNYGSMNDNPELIQLIPSLKSHYCAMLNDIKENHSLEKVVIITRRNSTELKLQNFIQECFRENYKSSKQDSLNVLTFIDEANLSFQKAIIEGKSIFIFPNFSFKDESYLKTAFKKLNVERSGKSIQVYSMSLLKENDQFDGSLLKSLNVKIATSKYVERDEESIKSFDKLYFETFGNLPTNDAYEGYDHLLFVGRALKDKGKNFQYQKLYLDEPYLQTQFDLGPSKNDGSIEYFENKYVFILEFDGIKFSRKN